MIGGRSVGSGREQPPRRSTWCTVECGRPTSTAIVLGLQPVRRRNSQIRCSSSRGTRAGEWRGRLERSARALSDSRSGGVAARHRRTHSQTRRYESAMGCRGARVPFSDEDVSFVCWRAPWSRRRAGEEPAGRESSASCCTAQRSRVVPVDSHQVELARSAWRRFGEGRHPAGLNFGGCFAYALAAVSGEALLCTGEAFPRSDIATVDSPTLATASFSTKANGLTEIARRPPSAPRSFGRGVALCRRDPTIFIGFAAPLLSSC